MRVNYLRSVKISCSVPPLASPVPSTFLLLEKTFMSFVDVIQQPNQLNQMNLGYHPAAGVSHTSLPLLTFSQSTTVPLLALPLYVFQIHKVSRAPSDILYTSSSTLKTSITSFLCMKPYHCSLIITLSLISAYGERWDRERLKPPSSLM